MIAPSVPEELLEELNPKQREAVTYRGSALLISAGAGSGKTRVLTHRIAGLLATGEAEPEEIMAITFTNRAAQEMRHRALERIGPRARSVRLSTFHSACVAILREFADLCGRTKNFSIYTADDQKSIVRRLTRQIQSCRTTGSVARRISALKNQLIDPDSFAKQTDFSAESGSINHLILEVYRAYTELLEKSNAFDFDDLLAETVRLLRENSEVLRILRARWRHLLVDEYQDTNHAQYALIKALVAPSLDSGPSLVVVGDSDQSIYAFRGADVGNIVNFERDFPGSQVLLLEQNYRSTQNILSAANSVICHNSNRQPKQLWSALGKGDKIRVEHVYKPKDEADFVVREIFTRQKQGERLGQMAVFYRTNPQSRVLEEAFMRAGLSYRIIGGTRFYDRAEIRDILAYLSALNNPDDDEALGRIINVPKRSVGQTSQKKLREYALAHDLSLRRALEEVSRIDMAPKARTGITRLVELLNDLACLTARPLELVHELLAKTGLVDVLEASEDPQDMARADNLREFVKLVTEFMTQNLEASLSDFLSHVSLVSAVDEAPDVADQVCLMTLHTAKGLEYDVVFLTGLEQGCLPHVRSLNEDGFAGLEEERRLMYVGMTRARRRLYLSLCQYRPGAEGPSCFLREIDSGLLDWHGSRPWGWDAADSGDDWARISRSAGLMTSGFDRPNRSLVRDLSLLKDSNLSRFIRDNGSLFLASGDQIEHVNFGVGQVISADGNPPRQRVVVNFSGTRRVLLVRSAPIKKLN